MFFEQKAIEAIHGHYETAGRQGMMGFLVGDLFECPTSHVRYVVIDSTIRLTQAVYGDKTLVIVSRLWEKIQDELNKTDGHLIGWYHSHPPIAVELAPGDVETHLQYFKRAWQVALVLGSEHEGPVGGLFRPGPGEPSVSLPFYELIESDEGFEGGKKRSILPWINFATDDPAVVLGEMPPPGRATIEVVRALPSRVGEAPPPPPEPGPRSDPELWEEQPLEQDADTEERPAVRAPAAPSPEPATSPLRVTPSLSSTVERRAAHRGPPWGMGERRETPMKPPPNALSNLPLLAAGGYDIGEVESHESEPGVMTPRQTESVAPPRRRSAHAPKPFAPALSPRRRGGLVAGVLALLAGIGATGWYFFLRPLPADGSPPTTPDQPESVTSQPVVTASVVPVDSALLAFDHMSDSVTIAVRGYDDRTKLHGANQLDCEGLSQGLVAVEEVWITYNVGKRKAPPLDAVRNARDQTLYAAVDSVERHFDRSGCERP